MPLRCWVAVARVDFGADNAHSPDGAHYLVASGCNGTVGYNCTWTQASHIYLLR